MKLLKGLGAKDRKEKKRKGGQNSQDVIGNNLWKTQSANIGKKNRIETALQEKVSKKRSAIGR